MSEKPSVASAEDFHDRPKPIAVGVDMAKGSDAGSVMLILGGTAFCSVHGRNHDEACQHCRDALSMTVANDQAAMDDAARRPPAGEIPTIPPLSAEAWERALMADTRSKGFAQLVDQVCGFPGPDLGKAMREAEEAGAEEGAAVRRALALLGTLADDDRLLLDLLCNEIERLRGEHAAPWDKHEAQGQVEHLDRENARLRRELAEANQRAKAVEQRMRGITFHTNDAGELIRIDERDQDQRVVRVMWDKRERTAANGVILVEPFEDVKPRDDSWPPPSHRPRMLP